MTLTMINYGMTHYTLVNTESHLAKNKQAKLRVKFKQIADQVQAKLLTSSKRTLQISFHSK